MRRGSRGGGRVVRRCLSARGYRRVGIRLDVVWLLDVRGSRVFGGHGCECVESVVVVEEAVGSARADLMPLGERTEQGPSGGEAVGCWSRRKGCRKQLVDAPMAVGRLAAEELRLDGNWHAGRRTGGGR